MPCPNCGRSGIEFTAMDDTKRQFTCSAPEVTENFEIITLGCGTRWEEDFPVIELEEEQVL